jgi:glycosyltransferase involved in cell wall biosynthesis
MNRHPLFSIITVTYNAGKVLEQTILSIANQTYPHIEYIIIDGNSQDNTKAIIQQHESTVSHWISEPDAGLYDAMNKGLRLATGDYLWFVNAGDQIHSPNTLRQIIDSIPTNTLPDILYGETEIINEQSISQGMRRLKAPKQLHWKSFRMGMLVCHQSFIVKRTVAPEYNLHYRIASDIDWCIRCLKQSSETHHTHLILSRFMENGLSSSTRKQALKERYRIMCKYYGQIPVIALHFWFAIRFYTAKYIVGRT